MSSAISSELTAEISRNLQFSSFELHLQPDWGAHSGDHRKKIQASLLMLLKPFAFDAKPEIHFYQPQLIARGVDFSVSHTAELGGFCLVEGQPGTQLGLDIETISRVKPEFAQRICLTEDEFLRAPKAAALWAAKEASFKSLKGPKQPKTVSKFEIHSWISETHFETFQFFVSFESGLLHGSGVTWSKDLHQIAIASVNLDES